MIIKQLNLIRELFYKQSFTTLLLTSYRNIAVHGTPIYPITDDDMWGFPPVWNQVFRVRFTKRPQSEEPEWMENGNETAPC